MSRRRRTQVVVAALLTALLFSGWVLGSRWEAARVTVAWSQQSPVCEGTRVDRSRSDPVITAAAGMRCVVTVRVHNGGRLPRHLDAASAPYAGVQTGAVVAADNADSWQLDGRDAGFDIDETLGSGRSTTFDVVMVFHPDGCNDNGSLRIPGWPRVSVTSLGRTHQRHARDTFVFERDGATPGCTAG